MSDLLGYILEHEEPFQSKNRLSSLYADFTSLKVTNPEGYKANVQAWRDALAHAARARRTPEKNVFTVRTGDKLNAALEAKGTGRPIGIRNVANEAVDAKQWYPLNDFLRRKQGVYYKPWIPIPAAEDVAIWCMTQVGLAKDMSRERDGEFVVLGNVEEASDRVIALQAEATAVPSSLVHSLDTFIAAFARVLDKDVPLNMSEISILLAHLYRDKRAIDMTVDGKTGSTTIKFSAKAGKQPEAIEEHDKTIANLRTMVQNLNQQVATLKQRIDSCQQSARDAVKAGNQKSRALASLRSKKLAESTLAKREASLEQIEQVLTGIDDAAGQAEMVKAMEASGQVLKDLNKQIGGVDRVEEVMDKLREGMADVDDVNKVLGEAGAENVDEDEVDEELEAMINEGKADSAPSTTEDALQGAPRVPAKEPTADELKRVEESVGRMSIEEPAR